MSQAPRGLGRGLSAILGDVPSADEERKPIGYINKAIASEKTVKEATADILRIPVELIQPNPFQPRQAFDQEALEELTASIRTLGLIQPITVRRTPIGRYQIISGERRYKACCKAGLTEVPAYIITTDDQGMMEMAIVENIQRENLDPIEIALSYHRLMTECHLTQEQMSERLGKKRTSVANQLRLLGLPVKVQHDLKVGQISVGHAKVILSVGDPDLQVQLCDLVIKNSLSVRALEEKVARIIEADASAAVQEKRRSTPLPQSHKDLRDSLTQLFPGGVRIKRSENGEGTLNIHFSSDAQVEQLLNVIKAAK
ncbi:MAG: ParB/RepB/Spo0J family partition protein [Bacteroidales bacterium]|nr:ParB/RepB/Spo0J family partition protein [Candidatus Cryptobacteroides aphodequi]